MPRLEKISITGFKNLKNFEVTDLKKINYFIGASGAGKSSVFELLTMLFRGRTRADV
jgi:predicted ATPase